MKILRYILLAFTMLMSISCMDKGLDNDSSEKGGLTLTLHSSTLDTRATMPGVDELNENKIDKVHYFLYKYENFSEDMALPVFSGVKYNLKDNTTSVIDVNLTAAELNEILFPGIYDECYVYIITNLPSAVTIAEEDMTVAKLRQIALEADFVASTTQTDFVMEGLGRAQIEDRKAMLAAKGTVPVYRVASKLTMNVTTDESVEQNGITYVPYPQSMEIELVNGVKTGTVGASPTQVAHAACFNSGYRTVSSENTGWACAPFYSYPAQWSIGDEFEPYIRIKMKWSVEASSGTSFDYQDCYYKVLLNGENFTRNTWYHYTINLSVLGSFTPEEEVIIDIDDVKYYVANWSEGLNVNSEVHGAKFLIVEKNKYVVYNENEILIPVTSSHPYSVTVNSATYVDLTDNSNKTLNANEYSITPVRIDGKDYVKFNHELDNNLYSSGFNFTPLTFEFTVAHTDQPASYFRNVKITQYPAIYGVAQQNSDYVNNSRNRGYAFVNGYNNTAPSGVSNFDGVSGEYSSGGVNSNSMFVISISTVEGTDYIIGDPRTNTIDEALIKSFTWASAPALYEGESNRQLKYYYPAESDLTLGAQHPTYNMVSPKFRICSGYGAVTDHEYRRFFDRMEGRCASYQEDGYPAGRWRLPTKAELEFVNTLSNKGLMPNVFSSSLRYWSAHGAGIYSGGTFDIEYDDEYPDTGDVSVRCVYDDWYWEKVDGMARLDDESKGTFTWGDMPRVNVNAN